MGIHSNICRAKQEVYRNFACNYSIHVLGSTQQKNTVFSRQILLKTYLIIGQNYI